MCDYMQPRIVNSYFIISHLLFNSFTLPSIGITGNNNLFNYVEGFVSIFTGTLLKDLTSSKRS